MDHFKRQLERFKEIYGEDPSYCFAGKTAIAVFKKYSLEQDKSFHRLFNMSLTLIDCDPAQVFLYNSSYTTSLTFYVR